MTRMAAWLLRLTLLVVSSGAFLSIRLEDAVAAQGGEQTTLVVYYANETTEAAFRSRSYQSLLAILSRSSDPFAAEIAEALEYDARESPQITERDIAALMRAARRWQFDLAMFTNRFALEHRYLLKKKGGSIPQYRDLPPAGGANDPILAASPLSRPEVLRAALHDLLAVYSGKSVEIILLVNTHGTREMAIMPRLNADFTDVDPHALLAELSGERHNDLALSTVTLKGTTKEMFWRVLAETGVAYATRFPLVFLESCQSGPLSWSDWRSIPASVDVIAHSGDDSLRPSEVDYGALLDPDNSMMGDSPSVVRMIKHRLPQFGVYVTERRMVWVWPALMMARQVPAVWYFLPLTIWLGIYSIVVIGRVRKGRLSPVDGGVRTIDL